MNRTLEKIHKKYIHLPTNMVKRNNKILHMVLEKIIRQMALKDRCFNEYYRDIFYGGSFYDNLKVGEPDEFDLDLLLIIPGTELHESDHYEPGHMMIYLNEDFEDDYNRKFINQEGYLRTDKFRFWFRSVVHKALNQFPCITNENTHRVSVEYEQVRYKFDVIVSIHENGPATNLQLRCLGRNEFVINVDLVPCLYFTSDNWPDYLRENPVDSIPGFFLAPKPPKRLKRISNQRKRNRLLRYWRLSFQPQEQHILKNKNRLKPCLRLLKMLRDNCGHTEMASYFLKTLFLNLTDCNDYPNTFWNQSFEVVFVAVLEEYFVALRNENISDYWDDEYNYLDYINSDRLQEMANTLGRILNRLKMDRDDPQTIYECFNIRF